MADHAQTDEPRLPQAEPACVAEIARLIVAGLLAVGVTQFDDATWNTITAILGGLLSIGLTWWTRSRVTPTAAPTSPTGTKLAPVTPPPPGGETP